MITAYDIITTDNFADMKTKIREMLKDGWQPHGRFFRDRTTKKLCQPMVKHEGEGSQED